MQYYPIVTLLAALVAAQEPVPAPPSPAAPAPAAQTSAVGMGALPMPAGATNTTGPRTLVVC